MKKVLLIMIGLSFFGIEAIAQHGQGRGRGHEIGRGKGHQKETINRPPNRDQSDRNRNNNGNRYNDRRDRNTSGDRYSDRRDRNVVVYRNTSRRPVSRTYHETVVVRHSPGIRYIRPIVVRPRVVVSPSVRVAYAYERVLLTREVDIIVQDMSYAAFDEDALQIAKNALRRAGIQSQDVAFLVSQLNFESHRLELAKYAWHRTVDKRNYNLVFNELKFRSSQRELDSYINPY